MIVFMLSAERKRKGGGETNALTHLCCKKKKKRRKEQEHEKTLWQIHYILPLLTICMQSIFVQLLINRKVHAANIFIIAINIKYLWSNLLKMVTCFRISFKFFFFSIFKTHYFGFMAHTCFGSASQLHKFLVLSTKFQYFLATLSTCINKVLRTFKKKPQI